jgi:GH43 family beta-xylosidase
MLERHRIISLLSLDPRPHGSANMYLTFIIILMQTGLNWTLHNFVVILMQTGLTWTLHNFIVGILPAAVRMNGKFSARHESYASLSLSVHARIITFVASFRA